MNEKTTMRIASEKGIALVLSLFLMTVMSVLGASLMFLSQTETYSSMNYRLMSQARYGAESGIQKTANYLVYSYTAPATGGADPITNYNTNVSPVICAANCPHNGQAVVLHPDINNPQANYPIGAVQVAFSAAVQGTLSAGNTTVAHASYATLMSMQRIEVYGGGVQTIQTWQISATGSIAAGKTAQVEVSAVLETPKLPAQMYGAFATGAGCGALTFSGNLTTNTDSYDSSVPFVPGQMAPTITLSGGNVGTNGNLTQAGQSTIHGKLSSPRVGVGNCSSGNVDALSSSGGATVNGHSPPLPGDLIQLPQAVTLAPPAAPNPLPPTTAFNGDDLTLPSVVNPGPFGDVTVSNNKTLTLGALGMTTHITMNTFTMSGNADLVILGTVILNVADQGGVTTPITFTGNVSSGNVGSAKFNPSNFQIQYAGTGEIKVAGNSALTAMIYAPNAAAKFTGGADFYGSVVAQTVSDTGGASIHYDRSLSSQFFSVGNPMMSAFNWKKY
jgi:Tfp pilus assembly protein PilX